LTLYIPRTTELYGTRKHWIEGVRKEKREKRKPPFIGKAESFRGDGDLKVIRVPKKSERYTAKKKEIVMGDSLDSGVERGGVGKSRLCVHRYQLFSRTRYCKKIIKKCSSRERFESVDLGFNLLAENTRG